MKNGVCPKCGKADVHCNDIGWSQRSYMALGWVGRRLKLATYICAACGYLEEYVPEYDLTRVAEKWPRVDPSDADIGLTPR